MKKNWLLCCDLQINLQDDNLLKPGKNYLGILSSKLPSEGNVNGDMYEFKEMETTMKVCRRNVHLFIGQYITLTCRSNGSLHLNLRNIDLNSINIDTFCLELMNEIRQALISVVGNS